MPDALRGGIFIHKAIEIYLKTGHVMDDELNNEEYIGFNIWFDWWHTRHNWYVATIDGVRAVEYPVYRGTIDLLAVIHGSKSKKPYLALVDWKFSNRCPDGQLKRMQTYADHIARMGYVYPQLALVVCIPNTIDGRITTTTLWDYKNVKENKKAKRRR